MTSDHRVAGSSPAGCKFNLISNLRLGFTPKTGEFWTLICPNFALISQGWKPTPERFPREMPALRFKRPRKAETGHDSKHHLPV
jgi:hypothetical protein